jgi:hypothetical protein
LQCSFNGPRAFESGRAGERSGWSRLKLKVTVVAVHEQVLHSLVQQAVMIIEEHLRSHPNSGLGNSHCVFQCALGAHHLEILRA